MQPESKPTCSICRKPSADLDCSVCAEPVCKKCVQRTSDKTFEFLSEVPETLRRDRYCNACYDRDVAPALEEYQTTLELARQVHVIPKTYRVPLKIIKKANQPETIQGCADKDEVIMKLAYRAARAGYNALIQAEVTHAKVRNFGYQTTAWSGTARPASIDAAKLELEEYREEVWRIGK